MAVLKTVFTGVTAPAMVLAVATLLVGWGISYFMFGKYMMVKLEAF